MQPLLSLSTGDDYSRMAVPNIITLNNTNKMECVSVNMADDNIVEGTERFYVQFSESKNNQIMIAGNDTVPVYIVDNEGKLLFTKFCTCTHIVASCIPSMVHIWYRFCNIVDNSVNIVCDLL